jgi:hypothetical protein
MDGFGNAGAVETILGRAKVNKSARLAEAIEQRKQARASGVLDDALPSLPHPDVLVISDFVREETSAAKGRAAFAGLYNIDHVGAVIDELEAMLMQAKAEGKSPAEMLSTCHMVFTGPPGTGASQSCFCYCAYIPEQARLPSPAGSESCSKTWSFCRETRWLK